MRIDRILFTAALSAVIGLTSCQREIVDMADNTDITSPSDKTEAIIRVRLTPEDVPETKSDYYSEADLSRIRNVVVYAVESSSGAWKRAYISSVTSGDISAEFSFFQGSEIVIYAVANMGNVFIPQDVQGRLEPYNFHYVIPNDVDLVASGFPMAKKVTIPASEFIASNMTNSSAAWGNESVKELSVDVELERLMARVVINIDKSDLTGGVDTPILSSGSIAIRQANRHLLPFSPTGSYARNTDDLFSGAYSEFDIDSFASSQDEMEHTGIVLYVPENRQGVIGSLDFQESTSSDLPSGKADLCTYIEYRGTKDGSSDGVGGDVCYRGYLGSKTLDEYNNETLLFSVQRNTTYNAFLSLTWDGLMWDADGWRIDDSDLSDGRRLILSSSSGTSVPVTGNSLGKLKRQASAGVYINFSRDGGSTWVHGVKDIEDWPYGWEFYIDGVKQTGSSGSSSGKINWSHTVANDYMSISPAADAVMKSTHTLQVKSVDGKVVSNVVSFEVGAPLGLRWNTEAPVYVAQRGLLVPEDIDDNTATVVYTITSGEDCVQLSRPAGGNMVNLVSLLKPGTATIHAACADTEQEDDITVTVTAPTLQVNAGYLYANPDGANARSFQTGLVGNTLSGWYVGADGELTVSSSGSLYSEAVGDKLARNLYLSLLAFRLTVTSPLLSASCTSGQGAITVFASALSSGEYSYPTSQGTLMGTLTVSPRNADTGVNSRTVGVYSVNPFSSYPSPGSVSYNPNYDIHDFSVIGKSLNGSSAIGGYTAPSSSTSNPYVSYSASFPSITATSTYRGFEAFMNDATTSEPLLTALFDGTPGEFIEWDNVVDSRSDEHTAGIVSLKAYVKNRHSNQKMYSSDFCKVRLFRHGAVVAYEDPGRNDVPPIGDESDNTASVSVKYYTSDTNYPSDGLGCAFPDIGTHCTSRTEDITWSDYAWGMGQYDGSVTITANSDQRAVRGLDDGWLLYLYDGCYSAHSGLNTAECHESWGLYDAQMYFCTADYQIKYTSGAIRRINENLVYLHPDGAPTTTVSGYGSAVGYYMLHTLNGWIQEQWL